MRLSILNAALLCLGCCCLAAIGGARAGELEDGLFKACDGLAPHYEHAAAMLARGADPNAVSPAGQTVVQLLLRQRWENSLRQEYDANAMLLALLLKNGADLPDAQSTDNPARMAAEKNDQIIWDILCLKYSESRIVEHAGRALDLPSEREPREKEPPELEFPGKRTPEELAIMLLSACGNSGGYSAAARLVAAGADVNAVSAEGETVLRHWFRHRYDRFFFGDGLDDLATLVLLLKNGAEPPAVGDGENNPVRDAVEMLDQGTWDILRLKYSESWLVGSGGWPAEPVAELTTAGGTLEVPPLDGYVPYKGEGLDGLRRLALRDGSEPAASTVFVPVDQAGLPAEKITVVAAVFERSDVSGLKGQEFLRAMSLSDKIHGSLYTLFFENAEFSVGFPGEPAPWAAEHELTDKTRGMVVVMSDSFGLGRGRPYQLALYLSGDKRPEREEGLVRACGTLASWRLALRQANGIGAAP